MGDVCYSIPQPTWWDSVEVMGICGRQAGCRTSELYNGLPGEFGSMSLGHCVCERRNTNSIKLVLITIIFGTGETECNSCQWIKTIKFSMVPSRISEMSSKLMSSGLREQLKAQFFDVFCGVFSLFIHLEFVDVFSCHGSVDESVSYTGYDGVTFGQGDGTVLLTSAVACQCCAVSNCTSASERVTDEGIQRINCCPRMLTDSWRV